MNKDDIREFTKSQTVKKEENLNKEVYAAVTDMWTEYINNKISINFSIIKLLEEDDIFMSENFDIICELLQFDCLGILFKNIEDLGESGIHRLLDVSDSSINSFLSNTMTCLKKSYENRLNEFDGDDL